MRRKNFPLVLALGLMLLVCGLHRGQVQPAVALQKISANATPEQVRKELGEPKQVARQIVARRYVEQWVFDTNPPTRLEFNHVNGEQPKLVLPETPR